MSFRPNRLTSDLAGLLQQLSAAIPDGEVFVSPDSTYAQNAVICLDTALRATILDAAPDPALSEFILEPAISAACEEETGFFDLGTEGDEWRCQALHNAKLRTAADRCMDLFQAIQSAPTITSQLIEQLRRSAHELAGSARLNEE